MTELLNQVKVSYNKLKRLESWLQQTKLALESLKSRTVSNHKWNFSGLPLKKYSNEKIELCFEKPSKVTIIGSFLIHSLVKPELNVDMAIEMPAGCFEPKDVHSYRYADKRCMYLGTVASFLKARKDLFSSVTVSSFRHELTKPILVLRPSQEYHSKFCIRLYPTVLLQSFPLNKLLPQKNNVKRQEFPDQPQPATPHYNMSILEDMFMDRHLAEIHHYARQCPAIVECIMLYKVWLRHRGMHEQPDTMLGFHWSMLLCHLMDSRVVNRHMSAYHMFRVAMEFISSHNLSKEGVKMNPERNEALGYQTNVALGSQQVTMEQWQNCFQVNFIDASGRLNLLSHMTATSFAELQREALQTLNSLKSSLVDGFVNAFMSLSPFSLRYDQYVGFSSLPAAWDTLHENGSERKFDDSSQIRLEMANAECDVSWTYYQSAKIVRLLELGLSDRIIAIRSSICRTSNEWGLEVMSSPSLYHSLSLPLPLPLSAYFVYRVFILRAHQLNALFYLFLFFPLVIIKAYCYCTSFLVIKKFSL